MSVKLTLSSEQLLAKVFPDAIHGYSALDVDEFIDLIINDYREIESNYLVSKSELDLLNAKIDSLRKENEALTIENRSFQKRFDGIKESDNPTSDNITLLKKINKLEKFLWKQGFDPNTIK
ncbi:MAG: DivIVA domain-containing protein [Erysipelotrichaceae bacterium]|nr:DivIVA domain-containing protein [Erysipelotrichaceae bacterium]